MKKETEKLIKDLRNQLDKIYGDIIKIENKYKDLKMDPRFDHGYSFYRGKAYGYEYVIKKLEN